MSFFSFKIGKVPDAFYLPVTSLVNIAAVNLRVTSPVRQGVPHPSPGSSDNQRCRLTAYHLIRPVFRAASLMDSIRRYPQASERAVSLYRMISPVGAEPLRLGRKLSASAQMYLRSTRFLFSFVCPESASPASFTISPTTVFHLHHNPSPGNEPVHVRKFSLVLFFRFSSSPQPAADAQNIVRAFCIASPFRIEKGPAALQSGSTAGPITLAVFEVRCRSV